MCNEKLVIDVLFTVLEQKPRLGMTFSTRSIILHGHTKQLSARFRATSGQTRLATSLYSYIKMIQIHINMNQRTANMKCCTHKWEKVLSNGPEELKQKAAVLLADHPQYPVSRR
jgi:hypothetical protein